MSGEHWNLIGDGAPQFAFSAHNWLMGAAELSGDVHRVTPWFAFSANSWFTIAVLVGIALFIGVSVLIVQDRRRRSFREGLMSAAGMVWIVPILLAIGWTAWSMTPHLTSLHRDDGYDPAQVAFPRYSGDTGRLFRPAGEGGDLEPWVMSGQVDRGETIEVPVHGGWRENLEEARNHAQREVIRTVREDLSRAFPATRGWDIPPTVDQLGLFRAECIEIKQDVPMGANLEVDMYRVHRLVELSESRRGELIRGWIPQVREFRLVLISLLAGMLTVCAAAGAACLRLDLKTDGKFRTWLRLATICAVLAAALATQNILTECEFRYLLENSILSA
jgi:hypothetical protein